MRGVCVGGSCGVCAGCAQNRRTLTGVFRECGACACVTVAHVTCATRARPPRESVRSLRMQTQRGGREPRRKFLEERTRDTRRPRFRRGRNRRLLPPGAKSATFWGGAKIGDFCHFGKSATFVPGGKRGPAAILINAYSGDFCHPVLSNAVAPEPLVYHSGTKCAILGHFRAPPPFWPFWAILGHFGHFWPFLALFGPPPAPPAPLFGPEFPRTSPKTSPRTSAMRKNSPRSIPRRKDFPAAHSAHKCPPNIFPPHTPRKFSPHKCAHKFGAQILRTNSAHKIRANSPAHISAQNSRTQILRRVLRRKIGTEKNY